MSTNRRFQFSMRTLLASVFCVAMVSLFAKKYIDRRVDFVDPPYHSQRQVISSPSQLSQSEIDELTMDTLEEREAFLVAFQKDNPPRGIDYWQQQAAKVEPGMTTYALIKYVPPASPSMSWLIPRDKDETTQVYCYAVDSEYAVLSEMTASSSAQSKRVVRVVGFFPHNLQFSDGGTLNLTYLDITNYREPTVIFGD